MRAPTSFHPWKREGYFLAGTAKAFPQNGVDLEPIDYTRVEPLAVRPCQMPQSSHASPERRLMAAVLGDALWLVTRAVQGEAAREAHRWLATPGHGLFAFPTVCDVLGVDPERVRRYVASSVGMRTRLREQAGHHRKKVNGDALRGGKRGPRRWTPSV